MPPKRKNGSGDTKSQSKKRKKAAEADSDDSDLEATGNGGAFDYENNALSSDIDIVLEGSMLSGVLLFCGGSNWDLIGRKAIPKGMKNRGGPNLWAPHRIGSAEKIKMRTVVSSCVACHSVAISEEGKAYTWGRNDKGQLGLENTERMDVPTLVEGLSGMNIIDAACGRNHTLFLTDRGKVYGCGDNKMGQLGLGHQSPVVATPTRVHFKGPPIRKVCCGGEFSTMADIRGNMYTFGCPEYGQLGHNTDGKFFVTSNKLSFKCELVPRKVNVWIEKTRDNHIVPVTDVEVRDIACGANHVLVLDSRKRVFSWGFGGYGRLGHAGPKDELVPRHLKNFEGPNRGAVKIKAGSTFSLAVTEMGALFCWGQTKSTGEAAMYPKLVHDLQGWKVRSVGCCNRSIMVAADESTVSWGPSPTYGELGYGENKPHSSTIPQEVKPLSGIYIQSISCGFAHSLLIARNDTEADQEKIDSLPVFNP